MLKDAPDYSSQPVATGCLPSAEWLDEPWRISMGKTAAKRVNQKQSDDGHHDLCSICMYADECMHRGSVTHPKVYCELFDVDVQAFPPHEAENSLFAPSPEVPVDLAGGLCCNCENRHGCTIRRSSGNVWHCEEYR